MCVSSKPKAPPAVVVPEAPVAPPAPAQAAEAQDVSVSGAREDDRRRKLRAQSANNTVVTGGSGLNAPAATGLKSAYGA